jgi:hypothetical protein
VGDEEMSSVEHAGCAYINTPATALVVNHRDRGPTVPHGREYIGPARIAFLMASFRHLRSCHK